jgi:hypothetical protein
VVDVFCAHAEELFEDLARHPLGWSQPSPGRGCTGSRGHSRPVDAQPVEAHAAAVAIRQQWVCEEVGMWQPAGPAATEGAVAGTRR